MVNDLLAGASHLCPYDCGIRGIARVHLPESYSLPSITGQPCIAHICARAIESLRFRPAPPRARAVNCAYVSLFFSLIGEKKESILSWRNLSSKIHSFENSDGVVRKKGNRSERGRGDIVPPSRSPHKSPQSAI